MSRLGKCNNFSGCLLAYRGEETAVPDGQPFICAECGKALSEVKPPAGRWIIYGAIGLGVIALIAAAATILPKMKDSAQKKKATKEAVVAPGDTPNVAPPPMETPEPPNPNSKGEAEPPAAAVVEQKVNVDIAPEAKAQVLKRIDLMPGLSPADKDKLYNNVERAKQMSLVITLPFAKGKTTLAQADQLVLKDSLEKPDVAKLLSNPVAVLVVLGYADPKGDKKANLDFSKARAEAVANLIKRDFSDHNIVRSIGMGGSTLLDAQSLEKNRIAEVWVVLP